MSDPVMLVLDESGLCVNAIVLGNGWSPPAGHRIVAPTDGAWIGWSLGEDGTWTPPPDPPAEG